MEKVASAPNIPAAVDATNNSNMGEMGGGVLTSKVTSGPTVGSASGEGGGAMPGTNLQQSPLGGGGAMPGTNLQQSPSGGGGLRRLHNGRFAPQAAREEDLKEGFVSRVRNVVKSGDMAITEKKKRIRIRKKKVTTVLPPGNSGIQQDTVTLTTVAQKKKRIRIRNRKRKQPEIVAKDDGTSPVEGRQSKRPARQHAKVSTYDESALDAAIEEQLGMQSQGKGHKRKLGNVDKDITMEAMIAAAIGFPRDALTEEEIEAGVVSTVGSQEQANYIVVRNHILATWRENVNTWLEQETVMETIRSLHSKLVASAYDFLLSHGYINFGVAPAIKAKVPAEKDKASVVVIGAGLAGLAAARHLLAIGHKVVVVEGRLRPGGRVYTKKMEGEKVWAAADLGGSVVTGIHGNPLGVLARQMNLPLHKIRDQCPIYQPHGQPAQKDVDNKVEAEFNKLLDTCGKWRENKEHTADQVSLGETLERLRLSSGVGLGQEERQLYDWHSANLEYANASLLTNLSLAYWDQDDPYEMGGDHCFLPGGNVQFVAALTEGLPIFYGKTVKAICYGNDGVKVIAHNQVFECDMVLCTVPLGVLKKGLIKFEPELPKRKMDAIRRLGFGLLNKVVMLFPRVFWGTDIDTFGHLEEDPKNRGEYFLFYSYAGVSGGPLLMALVAGEAAIKFERTPPLEAVTRVMSILRGIFEPKGIRVPNPVQTVCTRWGSDSLCFGSYSNVAVGASGEDYDILAESVDDRLFFAGEATNRQYPATMHGAFLSGHREAAKIARAAAARMAPPKPLIPVQKDMRLYMATLADLFKEPDLDFGSFSIIFDQQTKDPSSLALVRLVYDMPVQMPSRADTPEVRTDQSVPAEEQLHLYTTITRQQAFDLRDVKGGDREKYVYLCQKFGVKLVGRRGLGPAGDALVVAIKWNRAARNEGSTMQKFP